MKKFLRVVGKIIFILFTVFVASSLLIVGGIWGYQKYKDYKLEKYLKALPEDPTISTDMTVKLHGDEKIGGQKMTIQEKVDAGLNPYVADTSGNGISDWDALHTYHTDPKKFSTTDDGISDLAKIKEGLDPTKPLDKDAIEEFSIEDEKLDVAIHTNDLNAKYHSFIESYQQDELEAIYEPVREPVQFFNYTGEVELKLPEKVKNKKKLKAFYFDFDKEDFVEIKKQRVEDDAIFATINDSFPVFILDPNTYEKIEKYYYFRVSGFQFSRAVAGFDHKVFIFKRAWRDSDNFVEDKYEDEEYGITELSIGTIGPISAAFLDGVYALLDKIFAPLDGTDGTLLARALLDYGTVMGTPDYVKKYSMPWIFDEEFNQEEVYSAKVIDTGFLSNANAFRFGNMLTPLGDGGICAGIVRVIERVFNQEEIEKELSYKPETVKSWLREYLGSAGYKSLSYNLEPQLDQYAFLEDGYLYGYRFTDEQISYIGKETYIDDIVIDPSKIDEPDRTLVKMLETQWIYANEMINYKTKPYESSNITIIDQVEDALANGNIVYASLHKGSGGHAVNIYKMEYDEFDPDLIRLYAYDSNFPYGRLKQEKKRELFMNIYKKKRKTADGVEEYFEFDYTPFSSKNYSYNNTTDDHEIRFFVNDQALKGK
ncbi:hypothetical protein [Lederbergia galactosidilytica]|uniref:Uncharacterized protein n=1 Tax=Lederbergia galactosidilytica TaxID=217031 RepID=A0A177ZIH1_9BACI|nr:hypothetical protein [Lederbergia galactosidilytica]OAK67761.1 hypothetical protein ABB05_18860 [Lederbergia galactosidilytica]